MNDFVVLTEFEDKHVVAVSQISSKNEHELLNRWAIQLNYPRIGEKSRKKLLDEIQSRYQIGDKSLVLLRKTQNVYSDFFLVNGISIFLYIIEKKYIPNNFDKFAMFVFYKDTDYVYEKESKTPIDVLFNWAKYLSWHYFSREERKSIKSNVLTKASLKCIIENTVWYYESFILENKLEVYIVKS